jgi:hypothetical protein
VLTDEHEYRDDSVVADYAGKVVWTVARADERGMKRLLVIR